MQRLREVCSACVCFDETLTETTGKVHADLLSTPDILHSDGTFSPRRVSVVAIAL